MNLHQREQATADLDAARLLLDAARIQDAQARLNACLKRDPDLAIAHQVQAQLDLMRADAKSALAALDRQDHVAGSVKLQRPGTLLRIKALAMDGQMDLARTLLARWCLAHPHDAAAHRIGAGLWLTDDSPPQAKAHLTQVVALTPGDRLARRALAQHGSPGQALAQDDHADDAVTQLRAARQCASVGRLADAQARYANLLTQYPDDVNLWIEAARCDDQVGEYARAIRRLGHALRCGGPAQGQAWSALGRVQLHAGCPVQAGRSWWHATRCRPGDASAWAGLMICAQLAGRIRLRAKAQSWLHTHASRSERRRLFARLWQDAQGASQGRSSSQAPSGLNRLLTQATATFERAGRAHVHRADIHYHAAVCRQALGDVPQAYRAIRHALSINPQYAAARRLSMRLALPVRHAA